MTGVALTPQRKAYRAVLLRVIRALVRLMADCEVEGLDQVPKEGPLLVVFNHIGLLDAPFLFSCFPRQLEGILLDDVLNVPIVGRLLHWYGTIPVHRDQFDRNVIRRALEVLEAGRPLILSPEAGVSESGALRQARAGAAYLAVKAQVPVLPIGITGAETVHAIWDNVSEKLTLRGAERLYFWRQRREKPLLRMICGQPFTVGAMEEAWQERRRLLQQASDEIMGRVASLLPPQYRGAYASQLDSSLPG